MDYRVVDVFAAAPFEGNPLTVLPDAGGLSDAMMQRIANETNHSETTFVRGEPEAGVFETRIFTPQTELPFAGHPTLGTAHVLGGDVTLRLPAGDIPVRREGDALWMTQNPATIGPGLDLDLLEHVTGVRPQAAACVASTGTPVGLMPVAGSEEVRAAHLDLAAYRAAGGPEIAVLYVFTTEPDVPGIDVHARSLAQFVGIPEDPATGGAAGPLAAWLARDGPVEGTIGQGIEMGRNSRIHVRCERDRPEVGGRVVDVARGTFLATEKP